MGSDAYSRDPNTRALMAAWHPIYDPSEPQLWCEGDPPPAQLMHHVRNGGKLAGWNVVGFDRKIWRDKLVPFHGWESVSDDAWIDSMHRASHANLPRSLDGCAAAVGMQFEINLKDKARIRRITSSIHNPIPYRVSDILWQRVQVKPELLEDLQWLARRCIQDVWLEEGTLMRLPLWPDVKPWIAMPAIDRKINDRGVRVDIELIEGMSRIVKVESHSLNGQMQRATGDVLSTTGQVEKLKAWLVGRGVVLPANDPKEDPENDVEGNEDEEVSARSKKVRSPWKLRKSDIADILARPDVPDDCRVALAIRTEAAKASTAKLAAMLLMMGPDGRLRSSLTMGGAQQTMRWSGSRWQPHNLVRDVFANPDEIAESSGLNTKNKEHKPLIKALCDLSLDTAIRVGRMGDTELARTLYERPRKDAQGRIQMAGVMVWVSRMLRRILCSPEGFQLLNGDFSQIEARITVWLAGQVDILAAFASGQDVYTIAAAGIYKLPLDKITKQMRQVGKVAILALGFGGGPHALLAMAYTMGLLLSFEEASEITKSWREANAATRNWWYATDAAAANAVMYPGREFPVAPLGNISYRMIDDCLLCRLPSGRDLRYWQPRLHQENWPDGNPKPNLSLTGIAIKGRASFRRSLYHTVLCENQVQGTAVDALGIALENVDEAGLPISLHVHDNIAAETPDWRADSDLKIFEQAMTAMPPWTFGLPVSVDADYGARFG